MSNTLSSRPNGYVPLYRIVIALGLLFAIPVSYANSVEIVYHSYSSPSRDKEIEEILYLSSGVALESLGYSSTREPEKGDIIFNTEYSVSNEGVISGVFTLSTPGLIDDVLASAERTFVLDYELDAVIDDAVNELLTKADFSALESPSSSIDGLFRNQIFPTSAGERGLFDGARLSAAVIPGGDLFMGQITQLMKYSYTGTTRVDVIIPKSGPRIFMGLFLSGSGALKNGDILGGTLFVTKIGPSIGISLGHIGPVMFSASASSGAALLSVLDSDENLHKTVPFAGASGTAYVRVWDEYFLLIESGIFSIFDQDLSFYTISSGIGLRREF